MHASTSDDLPRCPLCGRPMLPGASTDLHHLVPRSRGGREATRIHRVCHHKIHATFDEAQLAREYASWDALRAHPEIARFVAWVARKPPTFYDRSRKTRERRR